MNGQLHRIIYMLVATLTLPARILQFHQRTRHVLLCKGAKTNAANATGTEYTRFDYSSRGHFKDVDEDADIDLILHFKAIGTGIQCGDMEAS